MRDKLLKAFPSLLDKELSDEYIENHPNLMWDVPEIPLNRAVPLYVLWCVEHHNKDEYLIVDDTISALNKYAREKDSSTGNLSFKQSCNKTQVEVILEFLEWCKNSACLDIESMLSRGIKNWNAVHQSLKLGS